MIDNLDRVSPDDMRWLAHAVELAKAAQASGNPPYGSVLVGPDGSLLAEMNNTTVSEDDISAHPELKLAVWAGKHLSAEQALQTTLYTSTENCAMCAGAFVIAKLGRLVFAVSGEQARAARRNGIPSPAPTLSSREVFATAPYPIAVAGPVSVESALGLHRSH